MDVAGRGYAHIFDFGRAVDPPDDMDVAAFVDCRLSLIVKSKIGNGYRGGECGTAVRRALIRDDTLITSSDHGNVVARIDYCGVPEHEGGRCRREGCASVGGAGE